MLDGEKIEMSEEASKLLRESTNLNTITKFPSEESDMCYFGDNWALSLYSEKRAIEEEMCKIRGHGSNIYLANCEGTWYNSQNEEVAGYFYFKRKKPITCVRDADIQSIAKKKEGVNE